MKRLIWIIILLSAVSCKSLVSTNTAEDINKAENRIIKYNTGIQNQIEEHPELIEEAYTITKIDTVTIDPDTIKLEIPLQDTTTLDSLETAYFKSSKAFEELSFELRDIEAKNMWEQQKLDKASETIKHLNAKMDDIYKRYIEASRLNNQVGFIDKEKFTAKYKIVNGGVSIQIDPKPEYKIVEKSKTYNSIDIRKDYWEDGKFYWTFLLPILVAIYLFGDKLKSIFNLIVERLTKFVRKLIFKI